MIAILANPSIKNATDTITVNPVVGAKTVTAIAAAMFGGSTRLGNRSLLVIRNEDPVIRICVGPSTVTQQSGQIIEPGATGEFPFDPATAIDIYAISEGAAVAVRVLEK